MSCLNAVRLLPAELWVVRDYRFIRGSIVLSSKAGTILPVWCYQQDLDVSGSKGAIFIQLSSPTWQFTFQCQFWGIWLFFSVMKSAVSLEVLVLMLDSDVGNRICICLNYYLGIRCGDKLFPRFFG